MGFLSIDLQFTAMGISHLVFSLLVAMAACLGWFITAGGVHPAFNSELSSDPLEAAAQLPFVGWLQFILGCGAVEWLTEKIKARPGYVPGDILGAAYWVDNTDAGWVDYQNKELTNGRLVRDS